MTELDDVFDDDYDDGELVDEVDACDECGAELATLKEMSCGICNQCQNWEENEQ